MSAEAIAVKVVTESVKVADKALRTIWSMLDAASEKPQPSKFLSQQAIESIQGITKPNS